MHIVYLLKKFPAISETFVLNEILALAEMDEKIDIFSIEKPQESLVHDSAAALSVNYADDCSVSKAQLLLYLLKKFLSRPLRFLKTIWWLRRHEEQHSLGYFIWFPLRRFFLLLFAVEQQKPDHIHVHFGHTATMFALGIHLFTGLPYSFTTHAFDIFDVPVMLDLKHQFAAFAVTISQYNKKYLIEKFGVMPDKINVIRCGVDTTAFKYRSYPKEKEKKLRIVTVASFVETKGYEYLVRACYQIKKNRGAIFSAKIIGDGPLFDEIFRLIGQLNLSENFELLGKKTHKDVMALLDEADVFILPCVANKAGRVEGVPVSIMEAMARGLVVISTSLAGIPELIEDAAIMVEPQNVDALSDAIEHVYDMDNAQRTAIGEKSRRKIEQEFNLKTEARKLLELICTAGK